MSENTTHLHRSKSINLNVFLRSGGGMPCVVSKLVSESIKYAYSHVYTNISQTKILRVEDPGELPVRLGISPLENKILVESNP